MEPSLKLNRITGNIYNGSLYLALVSIVKHHQDDALLGKKVLMYSYGSGTCASVFYLRFSSEAERIAKLVNRKEIDELFSSRVLFQPADYFRLSKERELLYNKFDFKSDLSLCASQLRNETYMLAEVTKEGKRVYKHYEDKQKLKLENERLKLIGVNSGFDANFRQFSMSERAQALQQRLSPDEIKNLTTPIDLDVANLMIENCVGYITLPLGLAMNFVINKKKYIVPMATEEPSVIAAASNGAKIICQNSEGFTAYGSKSLLRGSIYLNKFKTPVTLHQLEEKLSEHRPDLILYANTQLCSKMSDRGGGVLKIFFEDVNPETHIAKLTVVTDVCDSMGANSVNTILEGLTPKFKQIFDCDVVLAIMSNLAPERIFSAFFKIPISAL